MNTPVKRKGRGPSNRKEEILVVAAELFARKGFEATSTREIGDAAGILSGSLYHHFKSKEEMLHELLKRFVDKLVPLYEKVVSAEGSAADTLKRLVMAGLMVSVENSKELTVIMHERKFINRNPEFSYVNDVMQDVERIWFGVLQEGVRSGDFRDDLDLNLVLRIIMDMISSTISWFTPSSRYSVEQVAASQLEVLFRGITL